MYYELYLDVLFLTNFLMNYLILRLVCKILKRPSIRIRCMLGGLLGAFGVCLVVFLPVRSILAGLLPVHVVISTFMVKIGCRIKDTRNLIRGVIAMYLISFLWGGMFFVLYQSPAAAHLRTFIFLSVISYELLTFGIWLYGWQKKRRDHCCEITLYVNEKSKKVKGLYDTGNQLVDALSGKPVSVVDAGVLESMFLEPLEYNEALKPHYISYHAVGTEEGAILVVTIDAMRIDIRGEEHMILKPALALSCENVSFTQHYQLILNPNLVDC